MRRAARVQRCDRGAGDRSHSTNARPVRAAVEETGSAQKDEERGVAHQIVRVVA